MGLKLLAAPFPWAGYSKKLAAKITNPNGLGRLRIQEGMRLVRGESGSRQEGNFVAFEWLVDLLDATVIDVKYQVFGQSALLGAAEVASELIVGKNYDQASRISADLIDLKIRDRPDTPAFPPETASHLNLVLEAIEDTAEPCRSIPLPETYQAPPVAMEMGEGSEYPGWLTLETAKKLVVLEEVLDRDIRPYIALDGGGVEIKNVLDNEVIISYQGNCTSCFSAVGATLSYIQETLRNKVHPDLSVTPVL